jgi:hypothetical protein
MTQTSFRFTAYRDFKRSLGKINAITECTELSVRLFVEQAKQSSDSNSFVQQLSRQFGVRVDEVDLAALPMQMAQYHVVSVHQQFELFLREFKAEHPNSDWQGEDGDDLFRRILKNLGGGYADTARLIGRIEVDVADYYRHVRNRFVHALEDKDIPVDLSALQSRVRELPEYRRLIAPNAYDAISFDDFVLFTRVVKRIAEQLCIVARPTDDQIVEILTRTDEAKRQVAHLMGRHKQNPDRLRNALATHLRSIFSVDSEEAEPIINLLLGR